MTTIFHRLFLHGIQAFILLFATLPLSGQSRYLFPDDWEGNWAGELHIFSSQGLQQRIPMELHISPIDSNRWNWTLVYKGKTEDRRIYELVAIDKKTGHYQIDEKNSILLDAYVFDRTLSSRFSVNTSLLLINYSCREDHIQFDVFSGKKDETKQTGMDVEEVDSILAFPLSVMQRAILRPQQ